MKVKWANQEELNGIIREYSEMFSSESNIFIENVKTSYRILKVNETIFFPITINNTEWDNSFVCSPFTTYANYSKDEIIWKIKNKVLQKSLLMLVTILAKWLKSGNINKNIHINNFLLTTNPYPEWNGSEINEITSFIVSEYPDHAIIFRSLNNYQHSKLINLFKKNGYDCIGSRQVYIFDLTKKEWLKHRNNKHDTKLIEKSSLILVNHEEMANYLFEANELYQKLYLQKYSKFNPQFTHRYFQECFKRGIIKFQGYKDKTGALKAFSGVFTIDKTITSPLIGYDTAMPQKAGLYIHAAQLAILNIFETDLVLNLSSGAAEFKRIRGGIDSIEYSSVYLKHLGYKRKITWAVIKFLSNKIGVPIIKKYKL